jgi:hypothetical protein
MIQRYEPGLNWVTDKIVVYYMDKQEDGEYIKVSDLKELLTRYKDRAQSSKNFPIESVTNMDFPIKQANAIESAILNSVVNGGVIVIDEILEEIE